MSPAGWAGSVIFHGLVITLVVIGLPDLWRVRPPVADTVTVDVITVAEESVAPPESVEPEPEPDPEPEPEPEPTPPAPAPAVPVVPEEPLPAEEVAEEPVEPVKVTRTAPVPLPADKPETPPRPEEVMSFTSVRDSLLVDRREPAPEEQPTTFADVESALDGAPDVPVSDVELASLRRAIANQVTRRWIIQSGAIDARDLIVTIEVVLSIDARVLRARIVDVEGGESEHSRRVAAESALRAVLFFRDHPFENLDRSRYDIWKELIVRFDPSAQF